MKPWIWLRIAAALQAFFAFGHTAGGIPRAAVRGAQEQSLFAAMQSFRFDVMGATRSHWDFYQGFGLSISINLAILAVLMWQLGNLTRSDSQAARPLLFTLLISEILGGLVSWQYFFAGPIVTSALVVLCLSMALVGLNSRPRVASEVPAAG